MPSLHDVLADAVRAERSRRRLTQRELSVMLHRPSSWVHDVETRRRKLELPDLAALCRVLDVTLLDLCRGADPEDVRALGLGPARRGPGAPRT